MRQILVHGFIAALAVATADWSTPVVVRPVPPTTIGGSCDAYVATLAASGVIDGSGRPHPGACQHTELAVTVAGQPLAAFRARVDAWRGMIGNVVYTAGDASWPYQIVEPARIDTGTGVAVFTGGHVIDAFRRPPPVRPYTVEGRAIPSHQGTHWCVHAVGLTGMVGGEIAPYRLYWTPAPANRGMCNAEARRVDPAQSAAAALAAIQADRVIAGAAAALPGGTYCSTDRHGAEAALADAVIAGLDAVAAGAAQAWEAARPVFDPGAACVPTCGLCAAGWAGTVACSNDYVHNATSGNKVAMDSLTERQSVSVGGDPTPVPGGAVRYDALWRAVSGTMTLDRTSDTTHSVRTWRLDPGAWQTSFTVAPLPGGKFGLSYEPAVATQNVPPTTSKSWKKTFQSTVDPDFDVLAIQWPHPAVFAFVPVATPAGRAIHASSVGIATGLPAGYYQFGPGTGGATTCEVDLLEQP